MRNLSVKIYNDDFIGDHPYEFVRGYLIEQMPSHAADKYYNPVIGELC